MKRLAAVCGLALVLLTPSARAQSNAVSVAAFGLWDVGTHQVGGGVLALYNATPYTAVGAGFYYLGGEVAMPSANFQLQYELTLGPVKVTPWVGTAAATGLYGTGSGQAVGLAYAGLAVSACKGFDVAGGVIKCTAEKSPWLTISAVLKL